MFVLYNIEISYFVAVIYAFRVVLTHSVDPMWPPMMNASDTGLIGLVIGAAECMIRPQ